MGAGQGSANQGKEGQNVRSPTTTAHRNDINRSDFNRIADTIVHKACNKIPDTSKTDTEADARGGGPRRREIAHDGGRRGAR